MRTVRQSSGRVGSCADTSDDVLSITGSCRHHFHALTCVYADTKKSCVGMYGAPHLDQHRQWCAGMTMHASMIHACQHVSIQVPDFDIWAAACVDTSDGVLAHTQCQHVDWGTGLALRADMRNPRLTPTQFDTQNHRASTLRVARHLRCQHMSPPSQTKSLCRPGAMPGAGRR